MTTTALAPARAREVELLGPLAGSGYRDGAYLVRRGDGQTLQVTRLLYLLLEQLDAGRSPDQLAAALSETSGRGVSERDVGQLLGKLSGLGLLAGEPTDDLPRSNPLLALRWKVAVTDPRMTRRLTAPFAVLFRPWILWPVLAAFVAVCWFVLVDKGLAGATSQAFQRPELLLAVFAIGVASAGFHELGHAAACRYGGATPGVMGAGLYLVWPAFYTDVSDAYRLDRRGRLRVDLGGLYFNAVAAVAVTGAWLAVRSDALLLLVAVQLLQMVRQLSPVVRADGYHILADLTGVPDLYAHLRPTVHRLLPAGRRAPSPLTLRARLLVTLWVVVIVPVLLALLAGAVLLLPRLLASAWASGGREVGLLGSALERADPAGAGAAVLRLVALALPVAGSLLITLRMARSTATKAWTGTRGRPSRRAAAAVAAAAVVAALGWAWWPSGQYRPVRADERGTLPALVSSFSGPGQPSVVAAPAMRRLALVMVPHDRNTGPALLLLPGHRGVRAVLASGGRGVSFPFALPAAPRPGETQALALGTRDGGVVYDVAYALVTVTDGGVDPATTAYALASCRACTTVAVSYQVVLVIGQDHAVAPVDAAVAGNAYCPQCVTTALATQLVVTLREQPPVTLRAQLLQALRGLDAVPEGGLRNPSALVAQVAAVQQQVTDLLAGSGLVTSSQSGTATDGASPSPGTTPAPSAASTASPAAGADSATPQASMAGAPAAVPTATDTAAPSPSGSPSTSP